MARRGEALREHILDAAKSAFLETGFERTSMDAIAARAETSKRSLYAHFPTKDALFLAVVARIRILFGERIGAPAEHHDQPTEAIVLYCGRFVQLLRWSSVALTLRLAIAEAERLPALASGLYDVLFTDTVGDLAAYVHKVWALPDDGAQSFAEELIGFCIHPTLPRVLFGMDPLAAEIPESSQVATDVDLDRIRRFVTMVHPPTA